MGLGLWALNSLVDPLSKQRGSPLICKNLEEGVGAGCCDSFFHRRPPFALPSRCCLNCSPEILGSFLYPGIQATLCTDKCCRISVEKKRRTPNVQKTRT